MEEIVVVDISDRSSFKTQRAGDQVGGQIAIDQKLAILSSAACSHAIAAADRILLVVLRRRVVVDQFIVARHYCIALALVRHHLRLHFLLRQLLVLDSHVFGVPIK